MSLLKDIQSSLLEPNQPLAPVLLKLQFLASRLGSGSLEEWVKFESEGYPSDAEIPSYRRIGVTYKGTFLGPFGSALRNAPIPEAVVRKYAGDKWVDWELRQSISGIDALVGGGQDKGDTLQISASNLTLILQGKIYPDYGCNEVVGSISRASLVEVQNAVRSRILSLTLSIEKTLPESSVIEASGRPIERTPQGADTVSQITNQVVYGNYTTISSAGSGQNVNVSIAKSDWRGLEHALASGGLSETDAKQLAEIVAHDEPGSPSEPLGPKAKGWLAKNISKAIDGTWKAGVSVATSLVTDAVAQYYGLK